MNFDKKLVTKRNNCNNDRLFFFKYCTANVAKLVLQNRTLRWSTPATLNDPFDVQFDMEIKVTKAELKEPSLERLWSVYLGEIAPNPANLSKARFFEEFGPAFDEGYERSVAVLPSVNADASALMSDVKLFCMSAAPDIHLMWSHYADSHQGVVLRFRSIPGLDNPYCMAKPINYVDEIPELLSKQFLVRWSRFNGYRRHHG
jgi:hypothetical protein